MQNQLNHAKAFAKIKGSVFILGEMQMNVASLTP